MSHFFIVTSSQLDTHIIHTSPLSESFLFVFHTNTQCLIDRERELSNFLLFYKYHLGPPLYATYTNGYVYGYLEGDACTPEELTLPVVYKGVAQR